MHKKRRIVHLTSSLKIGGAEAVLFALVSNLDGAEYEHVVISFHDGPYADRLREIGIEVVIMRGFLCRYDPIFTMRLVRLIAQYSPEIIHSMLWAGNVYGRLIGWLLGIACVSVMHGNADRGMLRAALDRISLCAPATVVAVSPGVAQSLAMRDRWFAARQVTIIPNGVDAAAVCARGLQAGKTRQELGLGREHWVIGSVGRLSSEKNYPLLLRACAALIAQFPQVRLLIVGYGPQEEALRAYARHLGIEKAVIFVVGQMAHGYYPLFDCFALSSDQEGLSIALLEAMSFGLPCVVTHDGRDTHPALTDGHDGLLVPVGNEQELKNALARVISDAGLRRDLGGNAAATVRDRLSLEYMVGAYQKLFRLNVQERH